MYTGFHGDNSPTRCGFRKLWPANSGNSGQLRRCTGGHRIVKFQVLGPQGGAVQDEQPPAFQDPVHDGVGPIPVVEDPAPGTERLVGGEDHGPLAAVAVVHHVEQNASSVCPARRSTWMAWRLSMSSTSF